MEQLTKRKGRLKVERKHWPVIVLTLIILTMLFVVFYVLLKNPAQ